MDLDFIGLRNTLSYANNQTDFILDGLNDGISSSRGRNVEDSCIGLYIPYSLS